MTAPHQHQTWMATLAHPDTVAIRALGFLANNRDDLQRFLEWAGLSHADLRRHPLEPGHLAAVLDFLVMNETTLLDFSRKTDLPPEAAYEARRVFGSAATHNEKGHDEKGPRP